MMHRIAALFVLGLVASLGPVSAQEAIAESPGVISESHYDAAEELVELIGLEKTMLGSVEVMTDAMIQQNPMLRPYRDVILQKLDAGLTGEALRRVSLGAMTWPHQMARLMLWEQLFRAVSILGGGGYHRLRVQ